jgi:hypothetical protein
MAKIRNQKYAGKKHGIGSVMVQFDAEGNAECNNEIAESVKGVPGFELVELDEIVSDVETDDSKWNAEEGNKAEPTRTPATKTGDQGEPDPDRLIEAAEKEIKAKRGRKGAK